MRGQCYLIRYADDFVCCFQNKDEAALFLGVLKKRFAKFGLELAEEKTRILEFGRFAETNRKKRGKESPKPSISLVLPSTAEKLTKTCSSGAG